MVNTRARKLFAHIAFNILKRILLRVYIHKVHIQLYTMYATVWKKRFFSNFHK